MLADERLEVADDAARRLGRLFGVAGLQDTVDAGGVDRLLVRVLQLDQLGAQLRVGGDRLRRLGEELRRGLLDGRGRRISLPVAVCAASS